MYLFHHTLIFKLHHRQNLLTAKIFELSKFQFIIISDEKLGNYKIRFFKD